MANAGNLFWNSNSKIVEALTSKLEDFNAKMLNKRFEFLTKHHQKLDKIIPDRFKVLINFSLIAWNFAITETTTIEFI